jgi:hypothetical protein
LSSALTKAQPHIKSFASNATDSLIDSAVETVHKKLKAAQEGQGLRRRKRPTKGIKGSKCRKKKAKRSKLDLLADKF